MAIVKVPKNAALMAVDMFARNHWSIWMLWRNESLVGSFVLIAAPSPAVLASVLSFAVYVVDAQEEKYAALTGAVTNACPLS
mmetsp:Transcript_61748/g.97892  ORF Transcript_61748/g.97892 Transcript_61748/m.97892 type:complete len:82 (-) Transcript_61748:193-438(-)